jgi:16S rRNA (cytidine1402-2'-O)-methyltransferase
VDAGKRTAAIRRLEKESASNGRTQMFIETPYRNDRMLASLLAACRDDTLLCVAHGLSSAGEWVRMQPVGKWKQAPPVLGKVPCVFLLLAR